MKNSVATTLKKANKQLKKKSIGYCFKEYSRQVELLV
jgi:hypothetical protein